MPFPSCWMSQHWVFFFPAAFDFIGFARLLQVAAVATDESCREGEDGSCCSRRWGVLVHLFLLFGLKNR